MFNDMSFTCNKQLQQKAKKKGSETKISTRIQGLHFTLSLKKLYQELDKLWENEPKQNKSSLQKFYIHLISIKLNLKSLLKTKNIVL